MGWTHINLNAEIEQQALEGRWKIGDALITDQSHITIHPIDYPIGGGVERGGKLAIRPVGGPWSNSYKVRRAANQ